MMDERDNNTHDTIGNMWARGMPVRTGPVMAGG
jgi:hypothetical protein